MLPPLRGVAHGEKRQRDHGQQGRHGHDQPQLLAEHGEHHVRVGGHDVLQPALARALAEKPAGGGGAHGARLLEAGVPHVLPGVAPGGEALGDIGLHAEHQKPARPAPETASSTVAKLPERMKDTTRKVAKKITAVPKSPISASAHTQTAEKTM